MNPKTRQTSNSSFTGLQFSRKASRSVLLADRIAQRVITLSGIGAIVAVSLVGPPEWNRMEGIARYLGLSLRSRSIEGLKASFKGKPKRKGPGKEKNPPAKQPAARVKDRARDRKNIGKRRKPAARAGTESGFAPPKKA